MEIVTTTMKLTADNLPKGLLWEIDGACWRALRSITNPDEWRWAAQNAKAEAKGKPTGGMFDYYPIVGKLGAGHRIITKLKHKDFFIPAKAAEERSPSSP